MMLLSRCSWQHLVISFTLLLTSVKAYFIVDQPGSTTTWINGSPYPVTWTMGLVDGIETFDIEIARLSRGGVYFVAQELPYTMTSLNVVLQDVPAGDDYFLLCRNSSAGITYSVSSRFSVADANTSGTNPSPASAPTVTISGTPNPFSQFAQTFGPAAINGVLRPVWADIGKQVTAVSVVTGAILAGGIMTFY